MSDPSQGLVAAIVDGLKLCLSEAAERLTDFARTDRLPLIRARHDAEAWIAGSTRDFLRNVFETWIFAQHVYWSVGRGLADARARGNTILRLKVVLEENGWTLAPGVSNLSAAFADRGQAADDAYPCQRVRPYQLHRSRHLIASSEADRPMLVRFPGIDADPFSRGDRTTKFVRCCPKRCPKGHQRLGKLVRFLV